MLRTRKNFVLCLVCLIVIVCITSAVLITRASVQTSAPTQDSAPAAVSINRGPRNLFLQPEALRVARRLGKRFAPSSRAASVVTGTLTITGSEQPLSLTRQQTPTGEAVELVVRDRRLNWNEREGTNSSSSSLTDAERLLVERLTLDSPDQFVLAQLRGASYFTIARNVRPAEAVDGYSGPLWDLVRVDERQQDERLRPQSTWRIYYLNVQTGLPDRIEYQLKGQEIRVEFLEWSEQQGEKTPSFVRWTSNGQPVMEYRAATASHNQ
jgi:hypothetical protein